MTLIFNDTEIYDVKFNDVYLDQIYFNGTLIFDNAEGAYLEHIVIPTDATTFEIIKEV